MREIKFRAWDKQHKKWVPQDEFALDGLKGFVLTWEKYNRFTDELQGVEISQAGDKYEIMQFTGLHDLMKREIYEGDIVEARCEKWSDEALKEPYEVFWNRYAWGLRNTIYYRPLTDYDTVTASRVEYIIVGKIFEHPHRRPIVEPHPQAPMSVAPNKPSVLKPFEKGHGHVYPRTDGTVARCGGPEICHDCARDYFQVYGKKTKAYE